MKKNSGVYKIEIGGVFYFGSSANLKLRQISHLSALKRNKHANKALQELFNLHVEKEYTFEVLKTLSGEKMFEYENICIWNKKPNVNINNARKPQCMFDKVSANKLKNINKVYPKHEFRDRLANKIISWIIKNIGFDFQVSESVGGSVYIEFTANNTGYKIRISDHHHPKLDSNSADNYVLQTKQDYCDGLIKLKKFIVRI